jgi:hypothetical protein
MNAVVINSSNDIIFTTVDTDAREIEVAGAITIDGAPVNVRTHRVSRSKANLAKAARMDYRGLTRHSHNGRVFYTA